MALELLLPPLTSCKWFGSRGYCYK